MQNTRTTVYSLVESQNHVRQLRFEARLCIYLKAILPAPIIYAQEIELLIIYTRNEDEIFHKRVYGSMLNASVSLHIEVAYIYA